MQQSSPCGRHKTQRLKEYLLVAPKVSRMWLGKNLMVTRECVEISQNTIKDHEPNYHYGTGKSKKAIRALTLVHYKVPLAVNIEGLACRPILLNPIMPPIRRPAVFLLRPAVLYSTSKQDKALQDRSKTLISPFIFDCTSLQLL